MLASLNYGLKPRSRTRGWGHENNVLWGCVWNNRLETIESRDGKGKQQQRQALGRQTSPQTQPTLAFCRARKSLRVCVCVLWFTLEPGGAKETNKNTLTHTERQPSMVRRVWAPRSVGGWVGIYYQFCFYSHVYLFASVRAQHMTRRPGCVLMLLSMCWYCFFSLPFVRLPSLLLFH